VTGSDGDSMQEPASRVRIPVLREQLLAPLLDEAAEVLRSREPEDVPPSLRPLASFDRRGLRTPAARQQLFRALEADDEFHDEVVARFRDRDEVVAALSGWSASDAVRRVAEAADRGDLPLLASALYTARPSGWAFGLGAVATAADVRRLEREEDEARRARVIERETLQESLRRADAARQTAESAVARLERALRTERQERRTRYEQVERELSETRVRLEQVEAELERARAAVEAAEARIRREADRARGLERDLREARRDLDASEKRRLAAEHQLERAPEPGTGLRRADLRALAEAAELARRLADGLAGVAENARGVGRPTEARRAETSERPSDEPAQRVLAQPPPGMLVDTPEALDAMVQTPGVVVVVDGYNVSKPGWGGVSIADQRDRLASALASLHLRAHCQVTLVWDGADVEGVAPPRKAGVRIVFSAPGETADAVVVREVAALPRRVPVIVVSSDAEVRAAAEAEGASVVSAQTLLSVLRG
jgi:predicted RNA-binding protein with PIN domain